MSWQIYLEYNDVVISDECAQELFDKNPDHWDNDIEYVRDHNGCMYFEMDHMEGMDCVPLFIDVLKNHKVNGDIRFISPEEGKAWGYRFLDGKVKYLKGDIQHQESKPK